VPAVGGIAWLVALLMGALVSGLLSQQPHLFAALFMIGVLGAIDDRTPLPSGFRLMVQMVAVLLAFWDSAILRELGQIIWPGTSITLGILAWPFTVFAAVGVINAVNMFDGMDGLLGLLCFTLLCLLTALFYRAGDYAMVQLCAIALASLIPFLVWNTRTPWLRKARVFFGDAGSMSIGLLIAWIIVQGAQLSASDLDASNATISLGNSFAKGIFTPSVGLFLLAIPLIDTVSLMLRRLSKGRSPFAPDQDHIHHLLRRAGYSVTVSLLIIFLASVIMQIVGLSFHYFEVPESIQVLVFLLVAFALHAILHRAAADGRLWGKVLHYKISD
jgi:UDP-GlcNAc:undecaprenyl-phosphate/decaprenyl-phosphate GlcNAc-1-phosphate transferase